MAAIMSSRKKRPYLNSPAILVTLLLIHFNTINISRASSSSICNGSIHDCLFADADADDADDFEFLMDSHGSRMLFSYNSVTAGTDNKKKPVTDCGRYQPNERCLPNPNAPKVPENAGTYNRGRF